MIALVLGILLSLLGMGNSQSPDVIVIPAVVQEVTSIEQDAYDDAWCEFTNLFNSYETKWSKNNRLMMRKGSSGSFRFVSTK